MKHLVKKILLVIAVVIGVVVAVFIICTMCPKLFISYMQKHTFEAKNSYEPSRETEKKQMDDGSTYINDICYGTEYPNSYLDIYLSPKEGKNKPVFFFVHGGGYVWGDKVGGDPNTPSTGQEWYLKQFLEAGYDVVCPNYCFAPEYRYPTQILQVNQALEFLKEKGSEYGISTDQIVLGGGSAGGNIAGMLALLYTNDEVCTSFNAERYLDPQCIKSVVFCSALINNEDFAIAHNLVMDWLFWQCGRVAFHANNFHKSEIAQQTNIIRYVDEKYPPSYISDGNSGTFYSQAKELHERLNELGVKNVCTLYEKSQEVLGHGFETTPESPCAQENIKKTLDFLNEVLGGEN